MDIEKIIQRIIDNGNIEDMHKLSDMLEDTMEIIKQYDEKCYKEYEMKLYEMAYGKNLSHEMAEKIIEKMRPFGKKWTIEETQNLQMQYGINDINPIDFNIVMNAGYNDYHNIFEEDIEKYIKFTLDFIEDEDAKEGKVFTYFTTIVI